MSHRAAHPHVVPVIWSVVAVPLLAAGAIISFLAGFMQGVTGFGFVVAFAPAMLWFGAPRQVVAAAVTLGIPLSAMVIWETRRHLEFRRLLTICLTGLAGVPFGTWILAALPGTAMRAVVAITSLIFAVTWLVGRPRPLTAGAEPWLAGGASFLGGVLNASTGMGGPPLALVAAMQRWATGNSRGILATFNFLTYVVALLGGAVAQVFDITNILTPLVWLPTAVLGSWLGARIAARLSVDRFTTVLAGAVGASALAALLSLWHPV